MKKRYKAYFVAAVFAALLFPEAVYGIIQYNVDFESLPFLTPTVTSPSLVITGGEIVQNSYYINGGPATVPGKQYASWRGPYATPCSACGTITLQFDQPADSITFTLMHNSPDQNGRFDIVDDQGHAVIWHLLDCPICQNDLPLPNFPNPARFTWPWNGVKKLSITERNFFGYWSFAIDDLSYSFGPTTVGPKYGIVARLGDNPADPNPPAPSVVGTLAPTASIPLGRSFSIGLKAQRADGVWEDVPSSFALLAATPTGPAPEPGETLFPDYVVFQYDSAPNRAYREFQSVRLGKVTLRIIPDDHSLPDLFMVINSAMPASLGDPATVPGRQWDQIMSQQGSRRGIPPQYIKAIGYHESSDIPGHPFNIHAWRYEPNPDRLSIGPHRAVAPYSRYRLPSPETDHNYSLGQWICPQSVNPAGCIFSNINDLFQASTLNYLRNGVSRPIPSDDVNQYITIREICNGNTHQGWQRLNVCPPVTPPSPGARRRPSGPPDSYSQIATPHESASYGIMQTTWYSVVERAEFDDAAIFLGGANGHQNPALLFDDAANVQRGTASVIIGPNELRLKFVKTNGLNLTVTPNYDDPAGYTSDMRDAVRYYNGGGSEADNYADHLVMPLVPQFLGQFANGVRILSVCSSAPEVFGDVRDAAIVPGGSTTLSAIFTGATRYQWYIGNFGDRSQSVPDSDSQSVTVSPSTTTNYWVEASNDCGASSSSGRVTVVPECTPPQITAFSEARTVVRGTLVPLAVSSTGATSVQWWQQQDGSGVWTVIPDATTSTFAVTPQTTTMYAASVSNACGTIVSPFIRIVVTPCDDATITSQPAGSSITAGEHATLSVGVGGTAPVAVHWFAGDGTPAGNGTTITVAPSHTTAYYATATNSCAAATSARATVTVQAACSAPVITAQPAGFAITEGGSATLSLTATGTSLDVRWYTAAGVFVASGMSTSVQPPATTSYYAVISNACGSTQSDPVTITVTPACSAPSISAQSPAQTITAGGNATLSVTAAGSAPLNVEWFSSDNASAGTGLTIVVSPSVTTSYRAHVTNACGVLDGPPITITVVPPATCNAPAIVTPPADVTIESGQPATLRVVASGDAPLAYAWHEANTDVVLGTAASLTISPIATSVLYVVVSNNCGSVRSANATIVVNAAPPSCEAPAVVTNPQGTTVTSGTPVTLTAAGSGTAITYTWYDELQNLLGHGSSITFSPAITHTYSCVISNSCGSVQTAGALVTVNAACAPPAVTANPTSKTIDYGASATLSFFASGTDVTFQWYSISGVPISGAVGNTLTVSPVQTSSYYAMATNACGSVRSATATVTVICAAPAITSQSHSQTLDVGQIVSISVTATGANLHFQWYQQLPTDPFPQAIIGAQTNDLTIGGSDTPSGTTYTCNVSNACGSVISSPIVLTFR